MSQPSSFVLNPTSPLPPLPFHHHHHHHSLPPLPFHHRIPISTHPKLSVKSLIHKFEAKLYKLHPLQQNNPPTLLQPTRPSIPNHHHTRPTHVQNQLQTSFTTTSPIPPSSIPPHLHIPLASKPHSIISRHPSSAPASTTTSLSIQPVGVPLSFLGNSPASPLPHHQLPSQPSSETSSLNLIKSFSPSSQEKLSNLVVPPHLAAGLSSPQQYHPARPLSLLTYQPLGTTREQPSSSPQSSTCLFHTSSRSTENISTRPTSSALAHTSHPFTHPPSEIPPNMSNPPIDLHSTSADHFLISNNLSKLQSRISLPTFSSLNPRLLSIPFPSFEDDDDHAITEPIPNAALQDSSIPGPYSLVHHYSQSQDQLKTVDTKQMLPIPARKLTTTTTARSFLIGRKFDLDHDSIYSPPSPPAHDLDLDDSDDNDDDHDLLFKPYDSPTAKLSRSSRIAFNNKQIKPLTSLTKYTPKMASRPQAVISSTSLPSPGHIHLAHENLTNSFHDPSTSIPRKPNHSQSSRTVQAVIKTPFPSMLPLEKPSFKPSPMSVSPPKMTTARHPAHSQSSRPTAQAIPKTLFPTTLHSLHNHSRNQSPDPFLQPPDDAPPRLAIRKFTLPKPSAVDRLLSFSSAPCSSLPPSPEEDIRRAHLGVERCGGLGNKMFNSALLSRIPPQSQTPSPDSPLPVRSLVECFHSISPIQTPQSGPSNHSTLVLLQPNLNIEQVSPGGYFSISSHLTSSTDHPAEEDQSPQGICTPLDGSSRSEPCDPNRDDGSSPTSEQQQQHYPKSLLAHSVLGQEEGIQADSTSDLTKLDELYRGWRLLCHQVNQELKQSQERWPDTEASRQALNTFVMPSSRDSIFKFLADSRETYVGKSLPAPRRKQRTCLKSIFSYSQPGKKCPTTPFDSVEDHHHGSHHQLESTPSSPQHLLGSRSSTPHYLPHCSHDPSKASDPSLLHTPPISATVVVALPVPSAFVSPHRFNSPSSDQDSQNGSLNSRSRPVKPSSKFLERIRNESLHTCPTSVSPLGEISPNVSPSSPLRPRNLKPSPGDCGRKRLGKKKQIEWDALPTSCLHSPPPLPVPPLALGSSRKTKKAWKRSDDVIGGSLYKMSSHSSNLGGVKQQSDDLEYAVEEEKEDEEETGVLVASGENSFALDSHLAGTFNPSRSLRRYPSGRTPLMKSRSSARSMLHLRSSARSISRI